MFFPCYCLACHDLIAFPHSHVFQSFPTFTASCIHKPSHVHTAKFFFQDKVLFISRMHHRWLDLYFVWKTKMIQKNKRLSSCSDHPVQYCTKKWIKGQNFLSKGEMQVMGSGFSHFKLLYKTRQKQNLLEPYKHGYLLWNCHILLN